MTDTDSKPAVVYISYLQTCEQCIVEDYLARVFPVEVYGFRWDAEDLKVELQECQPACVIISPPPETEVGERKRVWSVVESQYAGVPVIWLEPDSEHFAFFLPASVPVIQFESLPSPGRRTGLDRLVERVAEFMGLVPATASLRHPRRPAVRRLRELVLD